VERSLSDGIEALVDAIISSELELDPVLCDKATRRWLANKVDDWLFDPRGRGASSGSRSERVTTATRRRLHGSDAFGD